MTTKFYHIINYFENVGQIHVCVKRSIYKTDHLTIRPDEEREQ